MSARFKKDATLHPELFSWRGAISEADLQCWLTSRALQVPLDLQQLWQHVGGGDFFETETILHPCDPMDSGDDVDSVNLLHRERGLPSGYLIFHVGAFGFSAVRLADQTYVLLDSDTYGEVAEFSDLDHWYYSMVRPEYAERYRLD
jgi:hypothetical protein